MNVLYYGGCWPTNIGNAFIDYGSMYSIKLAKPRARVYFASEFSRWLCRTSKNEMNRSVDLGQIMDFDAMVVSGMVMCDEFVRVEGPILAEVARRGIPIHFIGCGGSSYDQSEKQNFIKFLRSIEVGGYVSRDRKAYDNYESCFRDSHNGVDCAFFLSEGFVPAKLRIPDFIVLNFDLKEEPHINSNRRVIRTHHSCWETYPHSRGSGTLAARIEESVRHRLGGKTRSSPYGLGETLISDIPEDYLNLYANAYATYSDRVHACIASLTFGRYARLYSDTPRAMLFERLGASGIVKKLVRIDPTLLEDARKDQVAFLRDVL